MEDAALNKPSIKKRRRSIKYSKICEENLPEFEQIVEPSEIVMLTSYPPRECGIATFSSDLEKALSDKFNGSFKLTICPLETDAEFHDYPNKIEYNLNTDASLDYLKISRKINENKNCGLVLIQHEFGLFSGNENAFLDFLRYLDKPIVLTFHTVLPNPNEELKRKVSHMACEADGIIVMTKSSAEILKRDYGVAEHLITVIPHGTHLVAYEDKTILKAKYGLEGKKVLSTFGLLGPGKNIETTLKGLPKIIEEHPETMFLIIGKTHPTLAKQKGEDYREFLKYTIATLNLENNVRFINKFVPLDELLEYLQLTDIYLFTSNDPNQAVSGTFSYALSCGCPIVSTPIPHALEVLKNEAGKLFDFEDSNQLAEAVIDLLSDGNKRTEMSLYGLQSIAESAWENAAIAHAKIFERVCTPNLILSYKKPNIRLNHLFKMTTDTGVIQFCKINQPDIASGYTLDDNARALIAVCRYYELTGEALCTKYIVHYFNFIKRCFRPDGQFLNYVDENQRFSLQNDEVNLEDANGRGMWALGYLISISSQMPKSNDVIFRNAECIFEHGLEVMKSYRSPRAIAFILKGLYYFNLNRTNTQMAENVKLFADQLLEHYGKASSETWEWFEPYLTYGNSVLPHAVLLAHEITQNEKYKICAKTSFDFLLSKIYKGNSIQVISNVDWMLEGQRATSEFRGGEQPIDVAYTILALKKFHEVFPTEGYDEKMEGAFNWFMGDNALNQTIYNPCTGGCYDGLEKHNVNLNQGAESTISYLLARMAFENMTT